MNRSALVSHASDRIPVDLMQMAASIAVQRPYFAFDSLYEVLGGDWDIWGDFEPEQPIGSEVGPLATAEAGRHLAILGACAAALTQAKGERVYYLAARAQWDLRHYPMDLGHSPAMTARARIVDRTRKMVAARTELLIDNVLFAELSVRYQVVAEKTFEKLFSSHRIEGAAPSTRSPYAEALPLKVLSLTKRKITACSLGFSAARCEGHFPEYPMWPVAVVMYGLSQVMSLLLDHSLGRAVLYQLLHVDLEAHELVPASGQLVFSASLKSMSGDSKLCEVWCSAAHNGKIVATTRSELAIH